MSNHTAPATTTRFVATSADFRGMTGDIEGPGPTDSAGHPRVWVRFDGFTGRSLVRRTSVGLNG